MTEKLEKQGWTFAYIGANQDSMEVSKDLGISNAMNFVADACGTKNMSQRLCDSRARWFERVASDDCNVNKGFFDE